MVYSIAEALSSSNYFPIINLKNILLSFDQATCNKHLLFTQQ